MSRGAVITLARLDVQANKLSWLGVGNVEGVSAVASPGGGSYRLYIVTDNNFEERNATRLLAFDWKG